MHKSVILFISTLLTLASNANGSLAHSQADVPEDILRQRNELARRMDILASTLPESPQQSASNRLTQWYNWGNWRNW